MNKLSAHLQTKQHVIWDWNGTLLSDLDHALASVNRLLAEEGLPQTTAEAYKQIFGFPVVDYYAELGFDTSPRNFLQLCERFNTYFYEGLKSCRLWPGARELLGEIKLSGKKQSLLSASEHAMLLESVKLFGVERLFDHVFGIYDKTATSKVDRGLELMRVAGVDPKHTVLIGDTDHDLEVGEAMGVDVILVTHGHQCPTRLRAKHHTVVDVF